MIIDMGMRPPTPPFFDEYIDPPGYLKGYEHLYAEQLNEAMSFYKSPLESFLAYMNECGVEKAIISGKDTEVLHKRCISNDAVSQLVQRYPDQFIGIAGADPLKGMKAVYELEHAVTSLGLRGLNMEPFEYGLAINDKKFYPLYAKCAELGVPVILHCSTNFARGIKMQYGYPVYLDEVAVDFPELTVVASTPGWPWVTELVAAAWRNPNIYIEISAIRPKYFAMPGTGWGELLHYGNTVLQDRILFSSAWPLLPLKRTIDEVKDLPLKDSVKEKWLWKNAAQLFKLATS